MGREGGSSRGGGEESRQRRIKDFSYKIAGPCSVNQNCLRRGVRIKSSEKTWSLTRTGLSFASFGPRLFVNVCWVRLSFPLATKKKAQNLGLNPLRVQNTADFRLDCSKEGKYRNLNCIRGGEGVSPRQGKVHPLRTRHRNDQHKPDHQDDLQQGGGGHVDLWPVSQIQCFILDCERKKRLCG